MKDHWTKSGHGAVFIMAETVNETGSLVSSRRRWSIRNQLLFPMILLVVATSAAATVLSVIWIARGVRRQYEASTKRIIDTLTQSNFPLTKNVLDQMRGLSGVSFLLIDSTGNFLESSMESSAPRELPKFLLAPDRRDKDRLITDRGESFLVARTIIKGRGTEEDGSTLYLLRPEAQVTEQIYDAISPAILTGTIATVIATVMATWLARSFVRPMSDIVQHAATIARGGFSERLPNSRADEFGDLTRSINEMSTQLKAYSERLRVAARMTTLNQVGAALAHQLRNSAAGGRMAVELHQRICMQHDDEAIAVALRQFKLMESYLRQFLSMGSEFEQSPSDVIDLPRLIESTISLLKPMAEHAGVELTFESIHGMRLIGHDESLRQLVSNLVINGIEASTVGSRRPRWVRIVMEHSSPTSGRVTFIDSGDGPEAEFARKMFEPLATNKPDGVGLGLFVARQIAENHQGSLEYNRSIGATCFTFEFPLESC